MPGWELCVGLADTVKMKLIMYLLSLLIVISTTTADLYLHNPRGSNNRLNEKTAVRENGNRLFDSQNNNKGGYNVGDITENPSGKNEAAQYKMKYFQSNPGEHSQSFLTIEWTNQHGCGGNEDTAPQKQNCNLVLQYMCQSVTEANTVDDLRNGVTTTSQHYIKPKNIKERGGEKIVRKQGSVKKDRGLHESWEWYDKCYMRERNKGLFTADQKLKTNNGLGYSSAIYTRQNPNGNRRGYECPEERDYYPYWHPTPWVDIAVFADNASMCSHYHSNSFNVQPYGECVEYYSKNSPKHWSRWNNQKECEKNGGKWILFHNYLEKVYEHKSESACTSAKKTGVTYIWAVPYDAQNVMQKECLVKLDAPYCSQATWTRSNHLGNGLDGQAPNYTWILPYFPSGEEKHCVFRMRYNISTDDYDPYHTDASHNEDKLGGITSPVEQNPYLNIGGQSALRLAVNTAQYGRVFQDRSHVFVLRSRPVPLKSFKIFNLNVRGKRGNIVQIYPAVEYDFFPTTLYLTQDDLVHIQWTGSNTHNNQGDEADGEGRKGTDRNNFVQVNSLSENYPVPFENSTLWRNAKVVWIYHRKSDVSSKDLAVNMASAGYYQCVKASDCTDIQNSAEKKTQLNNLLDNAPASYEGAVLKLKKGTYHYTCSRNNNFTNRSQKGTIVVV